MSMKAPLTTTLRIYQAGAAAAADLTTPVGLVPFAGTVSGVRVIPTTVLTGADTNSRTLRVYNRGQAGAGTALVASKAFTVGVNAPANDATDITLTATGADLVVAAGDVLDFESLHVGGTGLADPGCIVEVDITRS